MTHPMAVTNCNIDMEALISDSNRSIATLAITTLLKTGNEGSVDRLLKQVTLQHCVRQHWLVLAGLGLTRLAQALECVMEEGQEVGMAVYLSGHLTLLLHCHRLW